MAVYGNTSKLISHIKSTEMLSFLTIKAMNSQKSKYITSIFKKLSTYHSKSNNKLTYRMGFLSSHLIFTIDKNHKNCHFLQVATIQSFLGASYLCFIS